MIFDGLGAEETAFERLSSLGPRPHMPTPGINITDTYFADLEGALRLAEGATALYTRIVRLAAASDGASRELVRRAS